MEESEGGDAGEQESLVAQDQVQAARYESERLEPQGEVFDRPNRGPLSVEAYQPQQIPEQPDSELAGYPERLWAFKGRVPT